MPQVESSVLRLPAFTVPDEMMDAMCEEYVLVSLLYSDDPRSFKLTDPDSIYGQIKLFNILYWEFSGLLL